MIFVGEGGAEKGHDPISHHSVDHTFIVVDRLQHIIEDGIEEPLRFFWIAICYNAERSHDVRKQDGNLLAFTFKITL